jgi:dUTP pyrophosphatase
MVKYRGRYVIITAINDNVATVEDNKFLFSEIPADELEFISRPSTGGEEISAALTKKGELTDYPMLNFSKPQRTRGFEAVTGYNPVIPTRATKGSAGYDICPIEAYDLKPGEAVVLNTGLKVYMLPDEYLAIHIRSSIGTKRRLRITNATGVIDSDYHNNPNNEGHIKLAIVNEGDFPYYIEADKPICQGIFTKYLTVDNDSVTTERTGGIGSTD